ncbi:selenocysteine-specific translation elongation factor [Nakamurella endophytica]|uniref:Selenocysteine-specific translation elongation factor n=1 Tax=Nakamurella endophytica TaxID=1748367 RepID=A0A917T210_9ACTN|nr:selenocysteine-specific translation elongation factor [Nakamurella endophytica]GGM06209.1 selenocysteine-specific translation elongation factor [Nakamurella endophytica]
MLVVATAGHVDHGKSTLVRALTGMEPDRWAEERRRGMTIDLGYAWTDLPDGRTVALVDVPGHERFLGNMLAGVGPAPSVMVVVAADEGWRRQSEEHLAAADALGVRHGLLVVTRSDLADPEPAAEQARRRLATTSLAGAEVVAVSGHTGAGLGQLCEALQRLADAVPVPDPAARLRLWVDRSFTVRGSGTVVTGTLPDGRIAVGDEVLVAGRRVRVRGLQSLGRPVERIDGAARVAVNLRDVRPDEVGRGTVLVRPGEWQPTDVVDVRTAGDAAELPATLHLHTGTASFVVHVRPLGADGARLSLPAPVPLAVGDRAVLRDPGGTVLTGVRVLDVDPPALRRRGAAAARARELADEAVATSAVGQLLRRGAVRRDEARRLDLDPGDDPRITAVGGWWVAADTWQRWATELATAVDAHAGRHPLDPALPLDAARRALDLPAAELVAPLAAAAGLVAAEGRVHRAGTTASLGAAEGALREVEDRLRAAPFAAPEAEELAGLGLGPAQLAAAERLGRVLRLPGGVVLLPDAPARAMRVLAALPGPFTLSAARQALGATRRIAVPLLEHLDRRGWTRRVDGDRREVRRS